MRLKRLFVMSALVLCCSLAAATASAKHRGEGYNIVFIGNSITYGAEHAEPARTAPPVSAAVYAARMTGAEVNYRNCGRSGATTYDFLPEYNRYFPRVERAVEELKAQNGAATMVFSIMLGTNDSASTATTGAPVSNENYERNLMTIINRLREMCPGAIFVLQRPIWYSPNTYNGAMYLAAGLRRLVGYTDVLEAIAAANDDIYMGDTEGFDFFRKRHESLLVAEDGNAGTFYLHPNEKGARKLARLWARAIADAAEAAGR